MSELDSRAKGILESCLRLVPTERAAYLDEVCRGDSRLREGVDAAIQAHERAAAAGPPRAMVPPQETAVLEGAPAEKPGDRIGRYKLLEMIGEGGVGCVWVAEQTEPIRREVALKLIKPGMDTRQVIARFEAERQALALMDHANIATVLDAGMTETGRPYFVMERVKGVPITTYCDQHDVPTRQRLDLFIQVCRAVQHAHAKGIIHRDLKPSNILVMLQDGVPMAKVIDFGIAKATAGQRLTEKTLHTAVAEFIGTPAYMSPEQAQMSAEDVDNRTDIYSMGVLLYELLTGTTPFDSRQLLMAGVEGIRRIIRDQDPLRPSTKLSRLDSDKQTAIAKHHRTEPPKLIRMVRGDLDWIILKTLEKDRERRYATAANLAEEISRFLNNRPVDARAPSELYRLRKFARRRKPALAAAGAIGLLALALAASLLSRLRDRSLSQYGEIEIQSDPEGAEVWLGDRPVGRTTYRAARVIPGDYAYIVRAPNHDACEAIIHIRANKQAQFLAFLRETSSQSSTNSKKTELVAALPSNYSMVIVDLNGRVECKPARSASWLIAVTNIALRAGDRLRTGPDSSLTLRSPDESVVRFGPLTEVEILPASDFKLEKGALHFFNKGDPSHQIKIITRGAFKGVEG
jgi:serine/threonine protein kinase